MHWIECNIFFLYQKCSQFAFLCERGTILKFETRAIFLKVYIWHKTNQFQLPLAKLYNWNNWGSNSSFYREQERQLCWTNCRTRITNVLTSAPMGLTSQPWPFQESPQQFCCLCFQIQSLHFNLMCGILGDRLCSIPLIGFSLQLLQSMSFFMIWLNLRLWSVSSMF